MRFMGIGIKLFIAFIIGMVIGVMVMATILPAITPRPMASILRGLFTIPAFKPPTDWDEIKRSVSSRMDIDYGDGGLTFDVHWPVGTHAGEHPVILWIHGGGFVGGSKTDTDGYCMVLASHGYTVVNMDYGLAPRYHHPRQVLDVDSVLCRLESLSSHDDKRVWPDAGNGLVIAGDSAGAHIAAEYCALRSNPSYRSELNVSLNAFSEIRGVVLLCGLYSLSSFTSGSWWRHPIRFMSKQIGWAITGHKSWHRSGQTERMDVVSHITNDYPPVFFSDGNWWTFDNQLDTMKQALDANGINHEVIRFPRGENRRLAHEFQFDLRKPESIMVLDSMLSFIEGTIKGSNQDDDDAVVVSVDEYGAESRDGQELAS